MFNNNLFQQQSPAVPNFNPMVNSFGQNNGLNFGNVAPAKTTTSTPEELSLIKQKKANNFTMTEQEMAVASVVTYENVEAVNGEVTELIDYIIDSVDKLNDSKECE